MATSDAETVHLCCAPRPDAVGLDLELELEPAPAGIHHVCGPEVVCVRLTLYPRPEVSHVRVTLPRVAVVGRPLKLVNLLREFDLELDPRLPSCLVIFTSSIRMNQLPSAPYLYGFNYSKKAK